MKNVLYFLSVLLICYAQSYAEEGASCHKLTITVSPFRLLNPELYLSGEKPLSRKVTIAAMIGAGRITNENITCSIMGIGGQIRYCLIDSFSHGVMIGPDIGYVGLGAQIEDPIGYLVGAHAGGFVGYKISLKTGFTAELQIGPIYLWGKTATTSELQTMEALNIGWSF